MSVESVAQENVVATEIVEIPSANLDRLAEKVADLNQRAEKLGVEPLRLLVHGSRVVEDKKDPTGYPVRMELVSVSIVGKSPVLNGWELIARITPQECGENLVLSVPGKECPVEFRKVSTGRCDHCHANRKRNDVFVLRHEGGEYKVVGRQCIADFLGNIDPDRMLNAVKWLWDADSMIKESGSDFWGCGGSGEVRLPIDQFVGVVSIFVRRFGFVSRAAEVNSGKTATASDVWSFLTPWSKYDKERVAEMTEKFSLYVEDKDVELARGAVAWAMSLPQDVGSDYLYNVRVACSNQFVTYKTSGLVASVISAYQRELDRLAGIEREKREAGSKRPSQHVGVVKERRGFEKLTVKHLSQFENEWGVKTLIVFETSDGDVLKWWATGSVCQWDKGDVVDVTGTVKSHEEYKGRKETQLSRVVEGLPPVKKSRAKKSNSVN